MIRRKQVTYFTFYKSQANMMGKNRDIWGEQSLGDKEIRAIRDLACGNSKGFYLVMCVCVCVCVCVCFECACAHMHTNMHLCSCVATGRAGQSSPISE